MDIKKAILKEHSKGNTMAIVKFIGSKSQRFSDLVDIFLQGPDRVSQRAAWPLSHCVEEHPGLILPNLNAVLSMLDKPWVHDAVKRNITRLLQFVEIPKRYRGQVANACFKLMNKKEPIAVRVFSMTVLSNLTLHEPDLKRELRLIIEDQLPYASAGFLSRAKKILKRLNE